MNISYNFSDKLKVYISKIDKLRTEILLFPLQPKIELRLKWDSLVDRVYWSLSINDPSISKASVMNIMSGITQTTKQKLTAVQKDVINQRKSFDYIKENWLAEPSPVTMSVVSKLYDISCRETLGKMSGLTEYSQKRIDETLEYLQKGKDHPVIQAGIAQIELINITPFYNGNGRVAKLLSYLFLYKNGYDVREMVSFEEFFRRDMVTLKKMTEMAKVESNLTHWLEYFAFCLMSSLEATLQMIKSKKFQDNLPATFWKLNGRQKQIMEILVEPGVRISNRDVQKRFNVSQITASRDLAKMVNVGALFAHGKGRSVYYTKV